MNPALKKLGYDERDRVVIIHADDIGMCQATLPAIADLFEFGIVSSAAVMTPCPWFLQTAAFCRDNPTVDMGVHLTVNCEWKTYRWGPISTREPASGMLDEQGYFHRQPPVTEQQADPNAVATELGMQVAWAKRAGIDITHVDAHMGSVMAAPFIRSYVEVALEHRLPLLMPSREAVPRLRALGLGPESADKVAADLWDVLEERGIPLFDDVTGLPLDEPADHVAAAKQLIDHLQPGLTMLLLHPAQDTPELRAIAPDWPGRVANYAACMSTELRDYIHQSGVQVIGYRPLRELIRASA
ncbi:MAG: polysaccharide deacetylase family protein [Caldilineaceae bacterium]